MPKIETGAIDTMTRQTETRLRSRLPVDSLVCELRSEIANGASSGRLIELLGQVYVLGTWGPQTVVWADFLMDEKLQLEGLSQNERGPLVRGLYSQGLSQRSIAPFLAVSHQTVKNDCTRLGLSGQVIGANGKTYSPLPKWHVQIPSGHSSTLGESGRMDLRLQDAA